MSKSELPNVQPALAVLNKLPSRPEVSPSRTSFIPSSSTSSSSLTHPSRQGSSRKIISRTVIVNWRNVVCHSDQGSAGAARSNKISTRKYTWLSFIPRNFFEQFRRLANFYFLVVSVFQLIFKGPFNPATSILPLIFVIGTTAIKQAYEDLLRQKSDLIINLRKILVLLGSEFKRIRSESIMPGDIIRLKPHHEIPCDIVFISFTRESIKTGVITANLDGETNLKMKDSIPLTGPYDKEGEADVVWSTLSGKITAEPPHPDLYEFVGVLEMGHIHVSLGPNNLLLRGSRLVSTEPALGIAVYVGSETKMALNSKIKGNKFTSIERRINSYLIGYFIILFLMTLVSFILSKLNYLILNPPDGDYWFLGSYLAKPTFVLDKESVGDYFSFFILYSFVIPISLYVSLSMVKLIGTYSLIYDRQLRDPQTEFRPLCNTSDLNEELGQIEYLFSDKTGTLTQNIMVFRIASISGKVYDFGKDPSHPVWSLIPKAAVADVKDFFVSLCICNSVQVKKHESESPATKPGAGGKAAAAANLDTDAFASRESVLLSPAGWEGDSPDETALVEAAAKFDIILDDSDETYCDIIVDNKKRRYKKLHIFPFDSDRKRMSVLVRMTTGEIIWVCKGAETVMKKLVSKGEIDLTYQHVESFAENGMRTLVVAKKILTESQYQAFYSEFREASLSLVSRKEKMEAVASKHERNFQIQGCTGVEDKLQEGVNKTIASLRQAGIKVWVLTGDKTETAVNVAHSVSLLDDSMVQFKFVDHDRPSTCLEAIEGFLNKTDEILAGTEVSPDSVQFALIVDGKTLFLAMKHLKSQFRKLCLKCSAVVCCRMSPIQKAEVVRMIKNSNTRPVTAAIGDGANDVSMIQEADIGFGLAGKEGRQALNSSDLGFSKFYFLERIILIHGHYYYVRVTNLIQYFFYKNSTLVTPLFLFSFYNIFSAQTLFHGVVLMLYNMLFTAFPVLFYGVLEKNISEELLVKEPSLYWKNHRNHNMNCFRFFVWLSLGIFHGSCCFFTFKYFYLNNEDKINDKTGGIIVFGNMSYITMVFVVNAKLLLIARDGGFCLFSSVLVTNALLHCFYYMFTQLTWDFYFVDDLLFGSYLSIVKKPSFWFVFIFTVLISLVPDIAYRILSDSQASKEYALIKFKHGNKISTKQNANSQSKNTVHTNFMPRSTISSKPSSPLPKMKSTKSIPLTAQ